MDMKQKQLNQIAVFTAFQPTAVAKQMAPETLKARLKANREFVKQSVKSGVHVVVVTDSVSHEALQGSGSHLVLEKELGMGYTRRLALRVAMDLVGGKSSAAFIWTEPEKVSLAKYYEKIAKPVLSGKADIVIPKRKSLRSYPLWQQDWERAGNAMCKAVLGWDVDYFFGPRVLSRRAADIFLSYPGKQEVLDKWDCIYAPLVDCKKKKLRTSSISIDFVYPAKQSREESRDILMLPRRSKVLDLIISGLVDRAKFLGL